MIILKSQQEIDKLRLSNQIVARVLNRLVKMIECGITTLELDTLAEELINKEGAKPAFKGYKGYKYTLCTSINEEVVHGIPSNRSLKKGDIISLDVGVYYNGYYGDAAVTVPLGQINKKAQKLLKITEESLYKGIEKAVPGNRLYDISYAIQQHVEANDFNVVKAFVGHGIGKSLHEEPQIPNFGRPGKGIRLKPGMVLAIEPMVNIGTDEVLILDDKWTAISKDRSLSAHFEHTIAIRENYTEILSKS